MAVAALTALLLGACTPGDPPDSGEDAQPGADTEADAEDATDAEVGASGQAEDAEEAGEAEEAEEQRYPDVVDAELEPTDGTWRLSATLSSPYDTPERYADAFRAVAEDGTVLGVRELAHDHANEQPFTRSLTELEIPADVTRITVEGRDRTHGWGGATVELAVPSGSEAGG